MNDIGEQLLKGLSIGGWIIVVFYAIPYLVRRGWGDAKNRTKKVCDTCFRDIKKFNQKMKGEIENE